MSFCAKRSVIAESIQFAARLFQFRLFAFDQAYLPLFVAVFDSSGFCDYASRRMTAAHNQASEINSLRLSRESGNPENFLQRFVYD
jgi:hypothetical protein